MNYSLIDIQKCSLAIVNEKSVDDFPMDLVFYAKYAWAYVCKFSDVRTSRRYIGILWEAAYINITNGRTDIENQR
jgi:hypothetical protein